MRILIAVIVWAAALVGAVAVSNAVSSSVHTTSSSLASAGSGSGAGATGSGATGSAQSGGPDPSSIKSIDPESLFRTPNFEKALGKARAALGANVQVDNFALYPGYLTVIADKGSNEIDFYVDANGRVQQTATGGSPSGTGMFRLSQISAAVPAALAHRIQTTAHLPISQLHYMVALIDPITGHGLAWLVYPQQGNRVEYFKASGANGPLTEQR
jgi:hypothetical protein